MNQIPATGTSLVPCEKQSVLIADDEKPIRELFSRILALLLPNCKVDVASNGAEAVEHFRAGHQKVLIMDLHMPIMDGEQAFHEIRKICESQKWQMPAVIFCTGYDISRTIKALIKDDPSHCLLTKPITSSQLVETIKPRLEV